MRLGISSYTYGWAVGVNGHEPAARLDEHGLLDRAHQHGIKLLQIGDNLPLHTFDDARLERLAAKADAQDVELEVGARRLTPERVAQYAAIARRLRAKLLRFVIDDVDYHPEPAAVTAILRDAAPLLDNVTLGIENHDRFPAALLRSMIEGAQDERIGVCLDTANSLGAGEGIDTVLAELGSLTANLHIKDFDISRVSHLMGFSVTGRPAGKGMLDIPALLRALERHGRCRSAVLELWTPPETTLSETIQKEAAWAVQSLEFLKPLFPESTDR
jgi:sugar phosphate isomerase/epimerase